MKRACLLIVVPALLVALGFAQTPTASSNPDPTSIKGCLGGTDGNYTFIEDNTGHNFKITTSSVDLKPHLGHDVTLVGQKATTGAADGSFAVTSLTMISEHCAAAAAAPVGSISTPADTAIAPPAAAAIPAATIPATADTTSAPVAASAVPAATVTKPGAEPAAVTPTAAASAPAPAATVPPAAETPSTPAAAATIAPNATAPAEPIGTQIVAAPAAATPVPTSAETASAPAAAATVTPDASARPEAVVTPKTATAHRTRMPADRPRPSDTPTAAAPPAETATPVADAAKPTAPDSAPTQTAITPDAAAATPAVTAKKGSPWLWISIAVVVLIMGTLVPLINRWRKRRLSAQSGAQNLSFSHRTNSEPGNSDKPVTRKAA